MREPIVPTAEDAAIAKETSHLLAAHLKHLSIRKKPMPLSP